MINDKSVVGEQNFGALEQNLVFFVIFKFKF